MNICFMLGGLNGNGGIGRVTSLIVNNLNNTNINTFVLAYGDNGKEHVYVLNDNVNYQYLYSNPSNMMKSMLNGLVNKLVDYIKKNKIDVIVACGTNLYVPTVIAARKTKIKSICWEHTGPNVTTDHSFQGFCRKYGAKKSTLNILLTNKTKEVYDSKYGNANKNIVIYNPIDPVAIQKSNPYNYHSKKIIAVGRLTYQKNYECMIEVMEPILKENPTWGLDIYGAGELEESIKKLIKEKRLEKSVFLKGRRADIYELYSNYAFILSTSRYEGFPMTFLEALANGLPIVSFDVETGPSEIIDHMQNGFLIKDGAIVEMQNAILQLMNNESLRNNMSVKSKEKSRDYEIEPIIDKWVQVLLSMGDKSVKGQEYIN